MRYYGSCNITIGTGSDGQKVEGKFNNTQSGRRDMNAAFIHNAREKEVINADPSRTRFNHDLIDIEQYKDEYYRSMKDADYDEMKRAFKYMDSVNRKRKAHELSPVEISKDDFETYRNIYRESGKKALDDDRAEFIEYRRVHEDSEWIYQDKETLLKGLVVEAESKRPHIKSPYELISDARTSDMTYYNTRKANGENHPVRKDAVIMIQLVLTLTRPLDKNGVPQEMVTDFDMKARERFESLSLEWAREKFKDPVTGKDNVVAATVHYDETSPHIHLLVCPEVDGRYNQHPFIGGNTRWKILSNEYGTLMAKEFGINKPLEQAVTKKTRHQAFRADKIKKLNELTPPVFDDSAIDENGKVSFKDVQSYIELRDEYDKDIISIHANELTVKDNQIKTLRTQVKHPDKVTENTIQTLTSRTEYLERTLEDTTYTLYDEAKSKTEVLELIKEISQDPTKLNIQNLELIYSLLDTEDYEDILREAYLREQYEKTEGERKQLEEKKQRRRARRKARLAKERTQQIK